MGSLDSCQVRSNSIRLHVGRGGVIEEGESEAEEKEECTHFFI